MIVFQVLEVWSSERNTENTKLDLYFNEENDYSEENTVSAQTEKNLW